ncbi:isopenicillin N synthase family dioxygenase [Sphingomonas oryzagri]
MPDTSTAAIPPVSLRLQQDDPDRFARGLGVSFERFGFAIIADHGIPGALIERAWADTKALFDLPVDEKRRYQMPDIAGARGYTPFGVEIAKGAAATDLKEFWQVGREGGSDEGLPNVWPDGLPGFRATFTALFAEFEGVGAALLSGIARHLGLAPDWFRPAIAGGNSTLRLLHYPPVSTDAPGVRAGAHEDIDLVTLLLGAEEAGLQLRDRDGRWLAIRPPQGTLVVNVGDMLQRLTNHVLPSTTHRVVNPPAERRGVSRYSMPFFLHPRPDFLIETLRGCVSATNPDRYPEPITERAYLSRRLEEIGLRKAP